ncbi:MAG: tripartite tricarboxylate transporter substrate binding protein [Alphaproteobacteria bacterium]|nr:tripartite tricarboxylate transporter substrate binding protein [Alphaproteobacteria bacterium]
MNIRFACIRVLVLALVFAAAPLGAQSWPTKPVRMIVPQPPGGGTDIVARLMAEQFGKEFGQSFLVENRPGAGTLAGTEAAAKAAPDGYTLLVGLNGNMALNPSLYDKLPYDPIRDFTAIGLIVNIPFLVVVSPTSPFRSIADVIAAAKASPGTLNYASAGNGTGQHMAMELFKSMTGTNIQHIPYRGAQAAYPEVVAGAIAVFFDNMAAALGQVQGGRVRAIAVTTPQRSPVVPDLPTVAEQGVPGYEYFTWFGLWAPARTPTAIVERLDAALVKARSAPELRERFTQQGGTASTLARAEVEPFVRSEIARWAKVIKEAGIKAD